MKKFRVVGVPEHFNYPWHQAVDSGAFNDHGIDLQWTDIPEGTGRMCQMLREDDADLAVILTEGVIKSIVEGNPVRIVQEFISSPLHWGIHVAANSEFTNINELKGKIAAISRFGSGSHLMSYVHARDRGWPLDSLQFAVVNNLNGAVDALTEGHADYFLWERFTTQPLIDSGVFRRVGSCPTPWPCFVLAARNKLIKKEPELLQAVLSVINSFTSKVKAIKGIDETLAKAYGQKKDDIKEWLLITHWSQHQISDEVIANVQDTLLELQLISQKLRREKLRI